jgi:diguanylate cyclase (GGDEF)-like protein
MEIKAYLKLLQKRWWIVLLLLTIVLAATAYFTVNMKPVYQAKATYIVRLSTFATEERNIISALNTLTGRSEIAATYAGVANSSLIQNKAAEQLGINPQNNLSVQSQIKSGMNIMEIIVQGDNPALVRDYTNAIGMQTVSYVESLYETYRLELLDEAVLPASPIRPNMAQNLILGGILGLVLGIGLVIFMEYLKTPIEAGAFFNILDERFGIYDMRYFRERLHQEMSRTRRHKSVLSIALINIDHRRLLENASPQVRLDAMRSVVTVLEKSLRNEDVLASLSDTELALLLPEMDGENAKTAMERVLAVASKVSVELGPGDKTINLNGAAGVAPYYSGDPATTDVLITRARNVLESMRESTYGRARVSTEGPVSGTQEERKGKGEELNGILSKQENPEASEMEKMIPVEEPTNEFNEGINIQKKDVTRLEGGSEAI